MTIDSESRVRMVITSIGAFLERNSRHLTREECAEAKEMLGNETSRALSIHCQRYPFSEESLEQIVGFSQICGSFVLTAEKCRKAKRIILENPFIFTTIGKASSSKTSPPLVYEYEIQLYQETPELIRTQIIAITQRTQMAAVRVFNISAQAWGLLESTMRLLERREMLVQEEARLLRLKKEVDYCRLV